MQRVLLNHLKSALILLFMMNFFCCKAQENVRFYVLTYPLNAYVELDGQKLTPSDSGMTATEGTHQLKVWMPDYNVVDSAITLKKNDQNIFRIYLKLSPQYIAYQKSLVNYKIKKVTRLALPVATLAIGVALWQITNNEAKSFYSAAQENERNYASTVEQETMAESKESFKKNRKNYKSYKAVSYGMAGLCVIPIVWTVRVAIQNSHKKPPVLIP